MAPLPTSEHMTEVRTVMSSYKPLLKPEAAAVGQLLDARGNKALRELEKQNQDLIDQVKNRDAFIMELQRKSVSDELASAAILEAVQAKLEKAVWPQSEHATYKRQFKKVDYENDDDDEDDFVYDSKRQQVASGDEVQAVASNLKAEKAMWAQKERAAHKRKRVPYHGSEDDDEDDDEINSQDDYKRPRVTSGDEDILKKIFYEVKLMVEKNSGCTGNTPLGNAFDPIRKLIRAKPATLDANEAQTTIFLISIMEQARKVVKEFSFDSSVGLGRSLRRIRHLLRENED